MTDKRFTITKTSAGNVVSDLISFIAVSLISVVIIIIIVAIALVIVVVIVTTLVVVIVVVVILTLILTLELIRFTHKLGTISKFPGASERRIVAALEAQILGFEFTDCKRLIVFTEIFLTRAFMLGVSACDLSEFHIHVTYQLDGCDTSVFRVDEPWHLDDLAIHRHTYSLIRTLCTGFCIRIIRYVTIHAVPCTNIAGLNTVTECTIIAVLVL